MNHPGSDDLLRHVLDASSSPRDLVEHVRSCAACRDELARLGIGASLLRGSAGGEDDATAECLDDDALAALAGGEFTGHERELLVAHLASCARCRRGVASVARALAEPALAHERMAANVPPRRRRFASPVFIPIGLAAAAMVAVAVLPRVSDDESVVHRAPTITAVAAPTPLSPVGAVAAADHLSWAPVAGADRYRVTLFDDGGAVLHEAQLADSVVALPDSLVLAPGRSYLWKVEARTGWERWATSELVEFSVAPPGAPR